VSGDELGQRLDMLHGLVSDHHIAPALEDLPPEGR
jgi:hypothetical protein